MDTRIVKDWCLKVALREDRWEKSMSLSYELISVKIRKGETTWYLDYTTPKKAVTYYSDKGLAPLLRYVLSIYHIDVE